MPLIGEKIQQETLDLTKKSYRTAIMRLFERPKKDFF